MSKFANSTAIVTASFRTVFGNVRYLLLSLGIFLMVLVFAIWLPNLSFVGSTITSPTLTVMQKANLLWSSLGAYQTNFTLLSRTLTTIIVALFAVQISFLVFYFKRRIKLQSATGMSLGGVVSGLVGIGCAACGSVILSSLFGLGFTAAFVTILPLQGQEFGLLGVGILGFAIFQTATKIQDPLTCVVN